MINSLQNICSSRSNSEFYLCANYFRVHDVVNSDDANRLHCDDDDDGRRLQPLLLLLPMTNPFGPCMLHHFLNAIRALHVSYFPIVRPKMLDYCEAVVVVAALLMLLLLPPPLLPPVAIAIAAVDPVFVAIVLLVAIAPNVQLSDVDCDDGDDDDVDDDEAPEIQEISFVDSNATTVADSNAECLSALFCMCVCVCVKIK